MLAERVMGFCTEDQVKRFLDIAPMVEKTIVESGELDARSMTGDTGASRGDQPTGWPASRRTCKRCLYRLLTARNAPIERRSGGRERYVPAHD